MFFAFCLLPKMGEAQEITIIDKVSSNSNVLKIKIGEEKKFKNLEHLKKQIKIDIKKAK